MIGLTTELGKTVKHDKEQKGKGVEGQAERRMDPRRSKRIVKKEEGTSSQGKKRGRKPDGDHMKTIIDSYVEGNPKEVRDQINSREQDIRDNLRYRDIPMEEWEGML